MLNVCLSVAQMYCQHESILSTEWYSFTSGCFLLRENIQSACKAKRSVSSLAASSALVGCPELTCTQPSNGREGILAFALAVILARFWRRFWLLMCPKLGPKTPQSWLQFYCLYLGWLAVVAGKASNVLSIIIDLSTILGSCHNLPASSNHNVFPPTLKLFITNTI